MADPSFDLSGLLGALQEQDLSPLLDAVAGSFAQNAEPPPQPDAPPQPEPPVSLPDPALLLKLTKLFSLLSSHERDPQTDLLLALRPLVSPEKQQRIDTAARMLQLLRLLPQLRELEL